MKSFFIVLFIAIFSGWGLQQVYAGQDEARNLDRLYIDEATISRGYTLSTDEGNFKVGVIPYAISDPVLVVAKEIPASHFPEKSTQGKVSLIYEYDIRKIKDNLQGVKKKASDISMQDTESLGALEKPIYVALKYDSDTLNKKVVHFWNKPTQSWIPLPSSTDFKNKLARAVIHLPYARLAVFEDDNVYEGAASWYAYKNCLCAASTIYPKGSFVRVTNIHPTSGKIGKSIIVRINDYGPDPNIHPDRVIDLDKVAFSELAVSLGSGLMMVRVEEVEHTPH